MPPIDLHASHCARTAPPRTVRSDGPTCSACHGHLVADLYIDMVDAGGHVWIRALRCVQCGDIEETGRPGSGSQWDAGKSGWRRRRIPQRGMNDEMTPLGT